MSRALNIMAAIAVTGMAAFVVAHAPAARAQDAAAADDLPPGPDHDLVKTTCTMCHAASQFSSLHHTAQEWTDVVSQMGAMGATIPPENVPKIVAYLTASFGPAPDASVAPVTPAAPGAAATPAAPSTPPAAGSEAYPPAQ